MKTFEKVISPASSGPSIAIPTSAKPRCVVIDIKDFAQSSGDTPKKFSSLSDVISDLQKTSDDRAEIENARRWIADSVYANEGLTLKHLRLHSGWSQTTLAEKLGTSQSHIARIERGTENLAISTCRRLCNIFKIDMNTLNSALERQEILLIRKRKR